MFLLVNIIGLLAFLGIAVLFSRDRKNIQWKSILILVVLNLFLAWFFVYFQIGRTIVEGLASAIAWVIQSAHTGTGFAFSSFTSGKQMDMAISALFPILLVVPLFDVLMYFNILPKIIGGIGWVLAKITRQPKFESFFGIEMMFLGNTEALAVSNEQLKRMNEMRVLTVAMMSMSSISGAIVGAYVQMIPGDLVLTAIPLNIINAIIVSSILNPVSVEEQEDIIYSIKNNETVKRQPFFSFLGDSVLNAGKLVLIIIAFVISFVALADLIDRFINLITGLVGGWIGVKGSFGLNQILGLFMYPFALLLGLPWGEAWIVAQQMAKKIVTNEFVVMGEISKVVDSYSPHRRAVISTFLVSFANFSTIGMIVGTLKGIVDQKTSDFVSKYVPMMLLAGILVSLLTAAFVGLFAW
ncbi:NupC/NupG family nucleoside CNT transporter [Staphylococcus sp. EG-SA-6]|jgi:purine nucleoside transport protein|uniref:Nucleoside transporter C-terminal domain-containing protein n=6 Tax=Staphylococcus haemolyticus TaxID=1283 RepID=A0A2A1K500_STAHA|nr:MULTISPECIES: nucleoside transporter C-terminal domain-containing protein [Staphylococcus]KDP51101.1 Na+ dependent nucleoside transporter C-terminal domain protein [Staphylococcus aureus subsp. aureus CO-98]MBN4934416.1 NupC/NupG family nucleoside CNT transporter [Staphylococcus sp. EG-SA-6]AKC76950.1 Na+ dependent nucleoside transporter domain-containing protein [Staphylococcus haemolyticus]AMW22708.1 nucleoside permease [Staphylococcus haemolyticus]AUV68174.1 NupC/NupG family nucleoside C